MYTVLGDGRLELLVQQAGGRPAGKNRLHLDLRVRDLDAEVRRLETLGARWLRRVEESGWLWEILADPEGNEFCALLPGAR